MRMAEWSRSERFRVHDADVSLVLGSVMLEFFVEQDGLCVHAFCQITQA